MHLMRFPLFSPGAEQSTLYADNTTFGESLAFAHVSTPLRQSANHSEANQLPNMHTVVHHAVAHNFHPDLQLTQHLSS